MTTVEHRRLPRDPWWTWDADEQLRDVRWPNPRRSGPTAGPVSAGGHARLTDAAGRRQNFNDKRPRVADTTGGMAREGTSLNDNS